MGGAPLRPPQHDADGRGGAPQDHMEEAVEKGHLRLVRKYLLRMIFFLHKIH